MKIYRTQKEVEIEFKKKLVWYSKQPRHLDREVTQKDILLQYLREHPEKIWWFAWEVVNKKTKDGKFLSHRAPARLTDLVIDKKCESREVGVYTVYRLLND